MKFPIYEEKELQNLTEDDEWYKIEISDSLSTHFYSYISSPWTQTFYYYLKNQNFSHFEDEREKQARLHPRNRNDCFRKDIRDSPQGLGIRASSSFPFGVERGQELTWKKRRKRRKGEAVTVGAALPSQVIVQNTREISPLYVRNWRGWKRLAGSSWRVLDRCSIHSFLLDWAPRSSLRARPTTLIQPLLFLPSSPPPRYDVQFCLINSPSAASIPVAINNGITEDRRGPRTISRAQFRSRDYKSICIGDFARREMSGSLEREEGGKC